MGVVAVLALASAAAAEAPNARLIALHDALHLSADQEAAWNAYAAALGPSPDALARRRATDALIPQVPTPRRIALIDAALSQDLADFRRQGAVVRTFYAGLTAEQQRTFDLETAREAP